MVIILFTLEGKLSFVFIEQKYLKKLHDVCPEVYYKSSDYERKPYIGILINNENKKYVIPLSSAKEKHKRWKNINKECYLIYEKAQRGCMGEKDIWVVEKEEPETVKHILAVLDIKKMIPIMDGVYHKVNMNPDAKDTEEIKKYKDLLNKEYLFCLKIIDEVVVKANILYHQQMISKKPIKFCCDFKKLEVVANQLE